MRIFDIWASEDQYLNPFRIPEWYDPLPKWTLEDCVQPRGGLGLYKRRKRTVAVQKRRNANKAARKARHTNLRLVK